MRLPRPAARAAAALALALAITLGGCAGIPVSIDHPIGTAYVDLQDDTTKPDGSKETCRVKASGGMEAKGLNVDASLCHKGDRLAGSAAELSGKEAQEGAIVAWEKLTDAQQQRILEAGKKALEVGGPLACVAVLTALGVPAAAPLCAALAGVPLPTPVPALLSPE